MQLLFGHFFLIKKNIETKNLYKIFKFTCSIRLVLAGEKGGLLEKNSNSISPPNYFQ